MRSKAPLKLLSKILLRTPELIPTIAAGLYHKHIRTDLDYLRADGKASVSPTMITLRITDACNHKCAICGQHGQRGYLNGGTENKRSTLPVEKYIKLIDDVAKYRPVINITGGEPFLYPGLMDVTNHAKRRGLIVYVTTNGVRLQECARDIVCNQWDVVLVSLDGPEPVHDTCRGIRGAFQTAHDGIVELLKQRAIAQKSKPYVNTSTTLSSANVHHLIDTFEIGRRLRPDLMVVFLSWFTSNEIGQQCAEVMKREIGIEAHTWKSYVREFSPELATSFQSALIELKKKSWPFDYFIVPEVGDENYARYYLEPGNFFGFGKCASPFMMTDIMPNGDVVTCRDYVDVKVGNILEDSLIDIWNGDRYVQYRKMMIRNNGKLPQCSRCCGLMGF